MNAINATFAPHSPCSHHSHSSPNSQPPPRARNSGLPPEFENLTEPQIDEINDLLRTKTYHEVQEQIQFHTGIYISINKLFRYYQKLALADALALAEDSKQGVQDLVAIYNGQPIDPSDLDQAGLEALKRRALQLASSPSLKPTLLLQLLRVFTWEHRKSMDEHRKQMDLAKAAHRDRTAELAERRVRCQERRVETIERQAQLETDSHIKDLVQQAVLKNNGGNLTPFLSETAANFLTTVFGKTRPAQPPA